MIYKQIGPRWEVAFSVSEGTFQQVLFANLTATTKGSTHVALVADQIAQSLIAAIEKKNKGAKVEPARIKNPPSSRTPPLTARQAMLALTTSKFGTKPVLSEEFMRKG